MKTISRIFAKVGAGVLMVGFALNFSACTEQSPFETSDIKDQPTSLNKRPRPDRQADSLLLTGSDNTVGTTKEQGSMTARYSKRLEAYQGGKITLSQGSQFELPDGSLIPPPELYGQQHITLTMTVVQNAADNELLFEFGPHGSTFESEATIRFRYSGSNPKLYYIEDGGTYTEQQPDEVDLVNGWLIVNINHFSRYAVAWSN